MRSAWGTAYTFVRQRRSFLGAVTAVVVVVVFALVGVAGYMIGSKKSTPIRPTGSLRDGTYRVDFDTQKATLNGRPHPEPDTNNVRWLAFRSSCTANECVATGTELDGNHQAARMPAVTAVLHFTNGHWWSVPNPHQTPQQNCFDVKGGGKDPGTDTETSTWLLEPQPDGTLRGTETTTVLTNECGYQGAVFTVTLAAARISDVPAGVAVPDPATVTAAATSSPSQAVGGPVLDGTYSLDYEYEKTTLNGAPSPFPNKTFWWAFRSLCTSAGCVATAAQLDNTNHQMAAGTVRVLHFAENKWQYATEPLEIACSSANQTMTATESDSWSLEPQPDGTLKGVETISIQTNECGNQGTIRAPFVGTRIGDVPPSVIVADPALFEAPPAPATGIPH
jgi:hypothetical protein